MRSTARGVVTAKELPELPHGAACRVAGVVITPPAAGTASGVVFITLEDETGIVNLILFRNVFETYHLPARHAAILLAEGTVERTNDETPVIHVMTRRLERLDLPGRGIDRVSRDFR